MPRTSTLPRNLAAITSPSAISSSVPPPWCNSPSTDCTILAMLKQAYGVRDRPLWLTLNPHEVMRVLVRYVRSIDEPG